MLGRGEDLDRLRRRDAALRPVHRVVVLRLQVVADLVAGAEREGRELPAVVAAQPPRRRGRSLQHHPLLLAAGALPDQRNLLQAVVVGGRPLQQHRSLRVDFQHRLLRGLDGDLRRGVGDDLDRPRGALRHGPPAGVGEAQAPLPRRRQRKGAGKLAPAGSRRLQLHGRVVDHREGLFQIAIGAGRDAHFRPPRRPQVSRGALFGAGRKAGVSGIEVRDRQVARDRRRLHRRSAAVSAPQPPQALRDVPGGHPVRKGPEEQRAGEREDRRAQRRGRQRFRRIDLRRRRGSPDVQQGKQLGGGPRRRIGGQFHAGEQLGGAAQPARELPRIERGCAPDEPSGRGRRRERERRQDQARKQRSVHAGHQRSGQQRDQEARAHQRNPAQRFQPRRAPPGAREERGHLPLRGLPLLREQLPARSGRVRGQPTEGGDVLMKLHPGSILLASVALLCTTVYKLAPSGIPGKRPAPRPFLFGRFRDHLT